MKRFASIITIILILVSIFCIIEKNSIAASLEVGPSGYSYKSIQSAIDAAIDGDIVLVHSGTYFENINFKGKSIKMISEDPNDPSATIIDGNQVDSVVIFNSEEDTNTIIKGFQIVNGKRKPGAGFYVSTLHLSLTIVLFNLMKQVHKVEEYAVMIPLPLLLAVAL